MVARHQQLLVFGNNPWHLGHFSLVGKHLYSEVACHVCHCVSQPCNFTCLDKSGRSMGDEQEGERQRGREGEAEDTPVGPRVYVQTLWIPPITGPSSLPARKRRQVPLEESHPVQPHREPACCSAVDSFGTAARDLLPGPFPSWKGDGEHLST